MATETTHQEISSKYMDSIANLPVDTIGYAAALGMIVLIGGYYFSVVYKRWSFNRRQAERRRSKEQAAPAPGRGRRARPPR